MKHKTGCMLALSHFSPPSSLFVFIFSYCLLSLVIELWLSAFKKTQRKLSQQQQETLEEVTKENNTSTIKISKREMEKK